MLTVMIRRSQQRRRDEKRAARTRDKTVNRERGLYRPPPRDTCEQRPLAFRGLAHERLDYVAHSWRQAGRLTEFQITVRYLASGQWVNIVEVDCKHGSVHYHVTRPGQGRSSGMLIHTMNTQADVAVGLKKATEVVVRVLVSVLDEWQEVEA